MTSGRDAALRVDHAAGVRVEDRALAVRRLVAGLRVRIRIAGVHIGEQIAVIALDPAARRRVVARGREGEARPVGQRVNALDEPLAPGALTDQHAAVVVLDGARDDLGGRGRAAIDQHHERLVEVRRVARGVVLLRRGRGAPARVDDHGALRHEDVADVDGLLEDSSRIAAQVEQELLHALLLEPLQGLVELLARGVGEVGQHDVADARLQHEGVAHRLGRDLGARDGQLDRLGEPDSANR